MYLLTFADDPLAPQARCHAAAHPVHAGVNPGAASSSMAIPGCTSLLWFKPNIAGHATMSITGGANNRVCNWPPLAAASCTGSWVDVANAVSTVTAVTPGTVIVAIGNL
jgi:hypothetical protein